MLVKIMFSKSHIYSAKGNKDLVNDLFVAFVIRTSQKQLAIQVRQIFVRNV